MSSMFDDFKEQVRSQANIVEIVSEYVPLKKRGSSYWGCCPFHGEKTPSFSVSPDKNFFYCFGCHAGGDVFTFIMKEENCTFQEALKILANKLGIPVPKREKTRQEIEREKETKEIIAANELATRFYQACLTKSEFGKLAQRYLAGRAIIVEGYMDAISLHAAGIGWAVASMGTAFSAEQAKLLARVCDEVVFSYDSDEAGQRADMRAVSIARAAGLRVKVLVVPDGKDPDEFVRRHGTEAYLELVKNAADGIDFQMRQVIAQNNVSNLAGKVEAVSNILPFLLECKNDIEVAGYIRKLAQLLTIDESLIISEYRKMSRKSGSQGQVPLPVQPKAVRAAAPDDEAEQQLLNILAKNISLLPVYRDEIAKAGFKSPEHQEIYSSLTGMLENMPQDVTAELFRVLSPKASTAFAAIMAKNVQPGDEEKLIADCIRMMNKSRLEALYEKHRLLADEYERLGDSRFLQELAESQKIKDAIKNLY